MSKPGLKIVFAGTPQFAAIALKKILHSNHRVLGIYTQPDRPAGRGQKLTASPVKLLGQEANIAIYQPMTLRDDASIKQLEILNPDVIVVAAYGLILPPAVLNLPRFGCINIHASLLPKWRGAAPIQRSILLGDKKTGITIMQMAEGLDTGDMLYQIECAITDIDTTQTLHDKLAQLGSDAILTVLNSLESNTIFSQPQDESMATYAKKIHKEEARINWHESAIEINRKIRAFNPWPVAFTNFGNKTMRIWEAETIHLQKEALPGTLLQATQEDIIVQTGKEAIKILKAQLPGGRLLAMRDLMNSHHHELEVGKQVFV